MRDNHIHYRELVPVLHISWFFFPPFPSPPFSPSSPFVYKNLVSVFFFSCFIFFCLSSPPPPVPLPNWTFCFYFTISIVRLSPYLHFDFSQQKSSAALTRVSSSLHVRVWSQGAMQHCCRCVWFAVRGPGRQTVAREVSCPLRHNSQVSFCLLTAPHPTLSFH